MVSLTLFLATVSILTLKSTPIVAVCSSSKRSSVKRTSRLDLPVPLSMQCCQCSSQTPTTRASVCIRYLSPMSRSLNVAKISSSISTSGLVTR